MAVAAGVVRRYYAYYVSNAYGFYLPVSVVYLTEYHGFGLRIVGIIKASFLIALTAAEIPTGYVGDRIGRRATLALGNGLSALGLIAYAVADTPLEFVLLNVVWATGWGFRSGTANAWLYELLATYDATEAFARISGRANTAVLLVSAASALLAGFLATIDWTIPFLANAALAAAGIPVLLTLPETNGTAPGDEPSTDSDAPTANRFTIRDATHLLLVQARRPEIRWLVAYVGLFYVLFQATRAFEQPAAVAVGMPIPALGVLYAAFKLVSAGAAATTGWVQDHLGTKGALFAVAPVLGIAYASAAFVPIFIVPVLFLNRGLHRVVVPLRNQYLNDRLDDVGRATVLSGVSMVLSLAAGLNNVVAGQIAERVGPVAFLAGAGAVIAVLAGLLWVAVSPVRGQTDDDDAPGESSDTPTD